MKRLFTIILIILSIPVSWGELKPLYEVGVASGVAFVPDYPAAEEGNIRSLTVPSFVYRGFIFRRDRRGTRARLFKSQYSDIDISIGGAFNANSSDNKARKGMDDLDWLYEIGPRLNYDIVQHKLISVELEFPLRLVSSTDGQFTRERGFRFSPRLDLTHRVHREHFIGVGLRVNYATETLNDYFYEVQEKDVTDTREEFDAKAGYIGSDLSLNYIYRKKHLLFITGIRHSRFDGSTNENSPLFRSKETTSLFMAFNYFFYQSKRFE